MSNLNSSNQRSGQSVPRRRLWKGIGLIVLALLLITTGFIHRRYQLDPLTGPRAVLVTPLGEMSPEQRARSELIGNTRVIRMRPKILGLTSREINEVMQRLAADYATSTAPGGHVEPSDDDDEVRTRFNAELLLKELNLLGPCLANGCMPIAICDASDTTASWIMIAIGGILALPGIWLIVRSRKSQVVR